jgi:hypothetical protein
LVASTLAAVGAAGASAFLGSSFLPQAVKARTAAAVTLSARIRRLIMVFPLDGQTGLMKTKTLNKL